jgi:cell division cycle 20-like protein 1 (cofactor of APC complex)
MPPLLSSKRAVADIDSDSIAAQARIATPPLPAERGRLDPRHNVDSHSARRVRSRTRVGEVGHGFGAPALDTSALDSALLKEFQKPQRESTPGASPHRKRQRVNGDRSVPFHSTFRVLVAIC